MVASKVTSFKTKGGKTVVVTLQDLGLDASKVSRNERKELTMNLRRDIADSDGLKDKFAKQSLERQSEKEKVKQDNPKKSQKKEADKFKDRLAKQMGIPRSEIDSYLQAEETTAKRAFIAEAYYRTKQKADELHRQTLYLRLQAEKAKEGPERDKIYDQIYRMNPRALQLYRSANKLYSQL